MRRAPVVLLAAAAVVTTSCSAPTVRPVRASSRSSTASSATSPKPPFLAAPTAPSAELPAPSVSPDPRVGAVFLGGRSMHTCTGSVLDSAAGDLILTAAHCVAEGFDASFVPGFVENAAPQDFWTVDKVYLDPRWIASEDPMADFAIARVSREDGRAVEAAAGGGLTLGSDPEAGTDVKVTGYAFGVGGDPIGCTGRTAAHDRGFPSLWCPGLVDGTSGSPWLAGSTIVGIIGGLDGGGCDENVSYTSPFDGAVKQLMARAVAGGPGDDPPNAFEDDC